MYLGDIVGPEGETQRYKELNRARTDFYRDVHFGNNHVAPGAVGNIYPASTGIGTDGSDVLMSCIALATSRDDVRLVPLENPLQTSAFDYAARYGPKSPKFARAMAVVAGSTATIFVSGTASITDSTSRHPDDVEAQTRQTLDNIEALISAGNFATARHAGTRGDAGRSGPGARLHQASVGLREGPGGLRGAVRRASHDLRGGRRLPAGASRGNRGRRLFVFVSRAASSCGNCPREMTASVPLTRTVVQRAQLWAIISLTSIMSR